MPLNPNCPVSNQPARGGAAATWILSLLTGGNGISPRKFVRLNVTLLRWP